MAKQCKLTTQFLTACLLSPAARLLGSRIHFLKFSYFLKNPPGKSWLPASPGGHSGCCSGGQVVALPPGGRNHSSKKTQKTPNRFHEKSRGVGGNVLVNFVWLFEPLPDTRASHLNLTHFSFAFCSSPLREHKAEEVGIYGLQPFPSASPCYFQRFSI